jgi:DUF971 family protein
MTTPQFAVAAGKLKLGWDDLQITLDGYQLRRRCRCAACRYLALTDTEQPGAVKTLPGTETATTILAVSPLGYGLQLHFSDDHNRGIFPWAYLREIAESQPAN